MTATTTDRSSKDTAGADDVRPPTPPFDGDVEWEPRKIPWRTIRVVIATILVAAVAVVITIMVSDHYRGKALARERQENALRDLRNRVLTEDLRTGQFVRVLTHDGRMVAVWEAANGLKTCNLQVLAPTKEVPRYSTAAYTATPATFRAIKSDPEHALGCFSTDSTDSFGGGG